MGLEIILGNGLRAIVDEADYERLNAYKWQYCDGYATRFSNVEGKIKSIKMHREVNATPEKMITDHINGNPLDNRKSNLRSVTNRQNSMNLSSFKGSRSKYKGVDFQKGKWRARIKVGEKRLHLGLFVSEVDAATAYNFAADKHYGQYARMN